ncbi:MAG: bifunctional adenosylcobinamide kinase/adenosylcobinamide-phosphate guanylyltransferase [Victivallales bacterium]|nr:bifunctional adenosylcobinamide kinase/adenosylcobinamide-phosphate guanylyltransferase [Victivallales bacterium]
MPSYLVTGGCRSGKSRFALGLAGSAENPIYIATAAAGDDEMRGRIAIHRSQRGEHWSCIEERINVAAAISEAADRGADFIVLDCITIWVSNIILSTPESFEAHLDKLIKLLPELHTPIAIVTNEVGSGIVPENHIARKFRDCSGFANQRIAEVVDHVFVTISGIPLKLK